MDTMNLEEIVYQSLKNVMTNAVTQIQIDGKVIDCIFSSTTGGLAITDDGSSQVLLSAVYIKKSESIPLPKNEIISIYLDEEWQERRVISNEVKANAVIKYTIGNKFTKQTRS